MSEADDGVQASVPAPRNSVEKMRSEPGYRDMIRQKAKEMGEPNDEECALIAAVILSLRGDE